MLEGMIIAFRALAPVFLTIATGIFVKRKKMLTNEEIVKLNRLVFRILTPCLVFCSIYNVSLESNEFDMKLVLYTVVAQVVLWVGTIPLVMKIEGENRRRGVMVQAINRTNFLIVGFPVINTLFGYSSVNVAVAIVMTLILNNILAVITMEMFRGQKASVKNIIISSVTNPLVIAAALGGLILLLGIKLPVVLESTVTSFKNAATPMALLVMGASLNWSTMKDQRRNIVICVVGRLLVIPAIALTVGALLGFRGIAFGTLIALFTPPVTTVCYTMSVAMDGDGDLASSCVALTSALAVFSMFIFITVFKTLGMF